MAKGRKLTMSRSERYLGSYSYGDGHNNAVTDQSELVEDDIWSTADDREHDGEWNPRATENDAWSAVDRAESPRPGVPYGTWSPIASAAATRRGGLSLAFEDSSSSSSPRIVHQTRRNGYGGGGGGSGGGGRKLATSAPVNVPDWSKIYRVNSVESIHEWEEEEEDSGMVPPHEYLAKSEARRSRKIGGGGCGGGGGASVFEGVGRTLKGRELRRVRDAVWNQTGFYG